MIDFRELHPWQGKLIQLYPDESVSHGNAASGADDSGHFANHGGAKAKLPDRPRPFIDCGIRDLIGQRQALGEPGSKLKLNQLPFIGKFPGSLR